MDSANLFVRLSKWAQRQDENFLTESLAVVLELLIQRAPAVGARLVADITNGFISMDADGAGMIEVRPQVTTAEGRPDLELGVLDRLAVLEVKLKSELRRGQLEVIAST